MPCSFRAFSFVRPRTIVLEVAKGGWSGVDDEEQLLNAARPLLESNNAADLERAALLFKTAAEITRQKAEARKQILEADKLKLEQEETPKRLRSDERRYIISLLVPLLSTAVLGGTLMLQTFQTLNGERDKQLEQAQQRNAQEDVRWSDAMKVLAQTEAGTSPAALSVQGFFGSERYGVLARQAAFQMMLTTKNSAVFDGFFSSTFSPVGWDNLSKILDLNRALRSEFGPLNSLNINNDKTFSGAKAERWGQLYAEMKSVCEQVSTVLKSPRPAGTQIDLRAASLFNCDFSHANLHGADVSGFNPTRIKWVDADLSGITNFSGSDWTINAWWQAARIDKALLKYLETQASFDAAANYAVGPINIDEYQNDVARLEKGATK
jgi:hypothetical protein